jgi:serine phosphatase RsbU (regulator of sigma subunit)
MQAAEPDSPSGAAPHHAPARGISPSRAAVAVFLIGAIVTAALALTCLQLYHSNERRLLDLRVRELGLVLGASVASIQTPLASAAELADVTGGDVPRFRSFIAPYVGPGRQYVSVSLWPLRSARSAPLTVVGLPEELTGQDARALFARPQRGPVLGVIGLLDAAHPALGYEFHTPGASSRFAAYAEAQLPADRRSKLESNSAFADLNYALYLGRSTSTTDLLVTSLRHLPVSTSHASDTVPFGDNALTVVVTANGSLGGQFFANLPWIVAVAGLLLSMVAALVTARLARGREHAVATAGALDRVATENRRLYAEQRGIAQTLQHALLPEALPEFAGLQVAAIYVPAASDLDIGGDWYDIVELDRDRALVIIGDVTGHGLEAAAAMAAIRHATLAYAALESRPDEVLARLSDFVSSGRRDHFATVLCILIDVAAHRLTVASAGHLPPLLVREGRAELIDIEVGVPIGVARDSEYAQTTLELPPRATVLAFTDGLVERRGESIDTGLERLRAAAGAAGGLDAEQLVHRLADELDAAAHGDDTAIVGIRWRT